MKYANKKKEGRKDKCYSQIKTGRNQKKKEMEK